MTGQIDRDSGAYRRGVVLGLTMAEIMLLLVFCLLIAAATIFSRDKSRIAELSKERDQAVQSASGLGAVLAELKKRTAVGAPIDDSWQKLGEAAVAVTKLEQAGLSVDRAVAAAPLLAVMDQLKSQGMDDKAILDAVAFMAEFREQLDAHGLTTPSADQMAKALLASNIARATKGADDWPPIISLSEASGHFFERGSAELSPQFSFALTDKIVPQLQKIISTYGADVVEVIGHTDEQAITPRPSNLDRSLLLVLRNGDDVATLYPGDNAGLGLARAVAVVQLLRSDKRLSSLSILPYSGAQLIEPGDRLTAGSGGDVKERRRIEIRVRRSEAPRRSTALLPAP